MFNAVRSLTVNNAPQPRKTMCLDFPCQALKTLRIAGLAIEVLKFMDPQSIVNFLATCREIHAMPFVKIGLENAILRTNNEELQQQIFRKALCGDDMRRVDTILEISEASSPSTSSQPIVSPLLTSTKFYYSCFGANCEGTSVHYAVDKDKMNLLKVLLSHQADINAKVATSPIELAAQRGNLTAVKLLLDNGANPNAEISQIKGRSLLSHLMLNFNDQNIQIIKYLLDFKADPNFPDYSYDRNTPLHLLALNSYTKHQSEITQMLIDARANINATNHQGEIPLKLASDSESLAFIKTIVENAPEILQTPVDMHGNLALHVAAKGPRRHSVEVLLKLGAKKQAVNAEGLTAAQLIEQLLNRNSGYMNTRKRECYESTLKILNKA